MHYYKLNKIVLIGALFSFMLLMDSCNTLESEESKNKEQASKWFNDRIVTLKSYLENKGAENSTNNFIKFLLQNDKLEIKKYMNEMNLDSLFIVPGNMPIDFIKKLSGLQLPGGYSIEGKSLIVFKRKDSFKEYVFTSEDTLNFDLKPNNKLGFSVTDTNLYINKRKFTNGGFEFRLSSGY